MSNKIAPHGPFTMEIKFYCINDAGDVAQATFDIPDGEIPPIEGLVVLAENTLREVAGIGPGWRLMTRPEFASYRAAESAGLDPNQVSLVGADEPFGFAWPK